jgi:hypothetical protein
MEDQEVKSANGPEIDEETWKSHVKFAESFLGSEVEYCKRNKLSLAVFRSYKEKYGFIKQYKKTRARAFVKVEASARPTVSIESSRRKIPKKPDPKWAAEFVLALWSE